VQAVDIDLMNLDAFVDGRESELFRALRDNDPLHWNEEPDGPGFWSLTRYEDIRPAAQDWATFSSAQGTQIQSRRAEGHGKPSLHNMDPPRHKLMRQLLVSELARASVQRMEPRTREVVGEHLDSVLERGSCELVSTLSYNIPILVFATLLGAPKEDAHLLLDWTNKISGQEDPEFVPDPKVMEQARQDLFDYFDALTQERRADPREDLVSVLVHGEVEGQRLERDELDPYYLLLTVAGNETTRNLMSGGILALHEHPGEWERLRSGAVAVGSAVEELVRYVSPVLSMRRTATTDVELHGKTIAAGDKVVLWWCSANRDERVFDDPERLILDRSPNKHMGFGWGPHFCLGSHLARLEGEVLLDEIVKRGIQFEVTGPPERLRSNFFRGTKRLPVTVSQ
jgi:cytochrome P450